MDLSRRQLLFGSAATAAATLNPFRVAFPDDYPDLYEDWAGRVTPVTGWGPNKGWHRRVTGMCSLQPAIHNLYQHHSGRKALKMRPHPRLNPTWPSVYKHLANSPPPPIKQRPAIIASLGLPPTARIRTVLYAVGQDLIQRPSFQQLTADPNHVKTADDQIRRVYRAYTQHDPQAPELAWCLNRYTTGVNTVRRWSTGWSRLTPRFERTRAYAEYDGSEVVTTSVPMSVEQMHFALEVALAGGVLAGAGISLGAVTIPELTAMLSAAITAGDAVGFMAAGLSLAVITVQSVAMVGVGLGVITLGFFIAASQLPGGVAAPAGPNTYTGYIGETMSDLPSVNDPGFLGGTPTTTFSFGEVTADPGGGDPSGDGDGCVGDF